MPEPWKANYASIGGYPGPKHPGSNDDWATAWVDELMAGASRGQFAAGTPGTVTDRDFYTGEAFGRDDFIDAGPAGESPEDYISGSGTSEGKGRTTRGGGGEPVANPTWNAATDSSIGGSATARLLQLRQAEGPGLGKSGELPPQVVEALETVKSLSPDQAWLDEQQLRDEAAKRMLDLYLQDYFMAPGRKQKAE